MKQARPIDAAEGLLFALIILQMTDAIRTSSNDTSCGYSVEQVRYFLGKVRELRNAQPAVQLDLSDLAAKLSVPRARTFANEGLGRRLPVIERAVLNIYQTYPPDRSSFLSKDECTDIAIQLHAFAINVYALFDNIVWVCILEEGQQLPPIKIGPFKLESQQFIPKLLKEYLEQPSVQTWYQDYGKLYRDSTAHRIAPYLPSRAFLPEDGRRWQDLHEKSMQVLFGWKPTEPEHKLSERLNRHEQLENEKELLGSNSLLVGLSLSGEDASSLVYLHPQLLCDWGLAQELVLAFTEAMRQKYGWEKPYIPPMIVN
jgi:hypothetical protein